MRNTHRFFFASRPLTALVVSISLSLAVTAAASDITGRDVAVRYDSTDAGTINGATRLLQRIRAAADRVCSPLGHGDLLSRNRRQTCEQTLTAAAVSRVNSPALATVYQSTRRSTPRVMARAQ